MIFVTGVVFCRVVEGAGENKYDIHHTFSQQLDKCFKYHLKKHRDNLLEVYIKWEAKV